MQKPVIYQVRKLENTCVLWDPKIITISQERL
jgi:hypothetical protein